MTSRQLRVAVVGAGPGGLCVAIGLAKQGHDVLVLERLAEPLERGLVNRDRSYPVDMSGQGIEALRSLGTLDEGSALRKRTLPFYGHGTLGWKPSESEAIGIIGTRDCIVLGLLEHISEIRDQLPGRIRVEFSVPVEGVDLSARTLKLTPAADGQEAQGAAAVGAAPFDLICACDGKFSPVRTSAAEQDPRLEVIQIRGRSSGEIWYKTLNVDSCGSAGDLLLPGWLYNYNSCVVALMPQGSAVGIMPSCPDTLQHKKMDFRQSLPMLEPFITAEEQEAYHSRPVQNAGEGFRVWSLVAGGCLVLLGDSAASPPPAGQGCNHACYSAVRFADMLSRPGAADDVPGTLEAYNREFLHSEWHYQNPFLGLTGYLSKAFDYVGRKSYRLADVMLGLSSGDGCCSRGTGTSIS